MTVNNFNPNLVDIKSIRTIGAQLRVIDDETWDQYKALFVNVPL